MFLSGFVLRGVALLLASLSLAHSSAARDYDRKDYYALHVRPDSSVHDLAAHLGLSYEGPFDPAGDDHHIFSSPKLEDDVVHEAIENLKLRRRKRDSQSFGHHILDSVLFQQKQVPRQRLVKRSVIPPLPPSLPSHLLPKKSSGWLPIERSPAKFDYAGVLGIRDPIFGAQWHLHNSKTPGHDLNITDVWAQGITGKNSTVCIIDDGLDFHSRDLADNYFPEGSYDFNDRGPDPLPRLSDDRHGTRCAGEVAAVKNDVCGVGVAYDAKVAAVRILSKPITDIDEAESVVYGLAYNDIYSCSWGPPDDGRTMDGPSILIRRALVRAVQQGRDGKGTIYVFAAGNGAAHDDNCNFDGYTNSIYSVTVGAIDKMNQHPYYSEKCSAQLVVTYSSGANDAIHTTDVGENSCTTGHGGTSAAGPLAAGVFALVLQVRPDLTWRDVQWLTALTAVPFYDSSQRSEWQKTPLGLQYHHQFGYGKLDAYAIVEKAKTWNLVGKQAWYISPWIPVYKEIPENTQGVESVFKITSRMLKEANLKQVEHVTVTMTVAHTRRGDISVELHSPSKIVSYLSTDRDRDDAMTGYTDWTFMSVAHWGEQGKGDWKIIVRDTHPNQFNGTFDNWRISLWGEAIDSESQPLRDFPEILDDVSPDREKIKAVPTPVPDPDELPTPTDSSSSTGGQGQNEDEAHNGFLPNPFPIFGISGGAKAWIFGAIGLIAVFVAGLGLYFFVVWLRKRRRLMGNAHGEYEFEILPASGDIDSDGEDGDGGAVRGGRGGLSRAKGTTKRGDSSRLPGSTVRAGELYDAFAKLSDGSDDEEDSVEDDRLEALGFGKGGEMAPLRAGELRAHGSITGVGIGSDAAEIVAGEFSSAPVVPGPSSTPSASSPPSDRAGLTRKRGDSHKERDASAFQWRRSEDADKDEDEDGPTMETSAILVSPNGSSSQSSRQKW